jgi:4-hydroxy-tetrahydrodipicolinate synthase
LKDSTIRGKVVQIDKFEGVWTALVTPFSGNGNLSFDYEGLEKNVRFQVENGANLVPTGTTGESPTLDRREHDSVITRVARFADGDCHIMAGTGSNSTKEALRGTEHAKNLRLQAVLLVDCYYNGPSSLELRTQYYEPVAKAFPQLLVTPYIIPGRTGTKMLAEDLAILAANYRNVRAVKEATGDFESMAKTRKLTGEDFDILSGDDDKTYEMMKRPDIKASGVVSVVSNIVPGPLRKMVEAIQKGDYTTADVLRNQLDPLFKIVTVNTKEDYEGYSSLAAKWKNPVPIKTLMNCLGLPAGQCRQPLGGMTPKAVEIVRDAARQVYEKSPELLMPLEEFYKINLEERIYEDKYWK